MHRPIRIVRLLALCALVATQVAAQDGYELYRSRREAFLQQMSPTSAALFKAAPVAHRNGDVDFEYRQDSNFYYMTGFEEPEAILVLSGHGIYVRDESRTVHELLFLREKNSQREIWEGHRLGVENAKATLGIEAAQPIASFESYVPQVLGSIDTLYIEAAAVGLMAPLTDELELIRRARERLYDFHVVSPRRFLVAMRQKKDAQEIALLQRAIDITCEAHRQAMQSSRPGIYEYQLEAVIEATFMQNGSERDGFPSIIGSGPNSCVLHYNTNRRQAQDGEVIVIDIGAEYGMYTADITRTIPVNGKFTKPQREIYEIVLAAQSAGIEAAVAGAAFRAPHRAATRQVVEGLIALGILKGDVEKNINDRTYRAVFMHGTSHYLGLDVHDVGTGAPLQPGDVITVEPGIYISERTGRAMAIPEKYWNIGVRIEDDVLITAEGPKLMSDKAPRTPDEIEKLMAEHN